MAAVFDVPADHAVRAAAAEHDISVDGDLILKRVRLADGRTRASINDQPVSGQALRMIGGLLVELHGQHDNRALVDPSTHRALLDLYGGHARHVEATRAAFREYADSRAALESQRAAVETARKEADYLRHAAEELAKLAPQPGEEATLAGAQAMMQGEKVRQEIVDAGEAIGGASSPIPVLSASLRRLERRAAQAPQLIEPSVKALDAALVALEEARDTVERALRDCDFDPRELEQAEERLFALRAAGRKYVCAPDELHSRADKFREDVGLIESGEKRLAQLERRLPTQKRISSAPPAR